MTEQTNSPRPAPEEGAPATQRRQGLGTGILLVIGALLLSWAFNGGSHNVPSRNEMMDAQTLLWRERHDEAIRAFTPMIERNPNWSWPYGGRGEAYRLKGDLERALIDLNEAIRLKPDFHEALFNRCLTLRRKGENDRALADCNEAARLKPDESLHHEAIAELLFANAEFERAYEKFGEIIRSKPNGANPYFHRGQIALFHLDRPAEAAEEFAKAAKEAFDYRVVGEMLGSQVVDGVRVSDLMAYKRSFVPDGIYLLIWTHMARARAGQDDFNELQEHAKQLAAPITRKMILETFRPIGDEALRKSREPWPGMIFALFLDHTTPAAVRAAAEAVTDANLRQRRLCDANFYIAALYLEKKRQLDEARALLQTAADECPTGARERAFAKAELKRMGW